MSENNNQDERVFQVLRKIYENTEIPTELSNIVQDAIEKAKCNKLGGDYMKEAVKKKRMESVVSSLMVVAAAVILFIGGFGISVHTNQAFAQSVKDVPILGNLASIFTGHNIKEEDEVAKVDALIPEVQGLKDKELQAKINKEVNDKIEKAIIEMKKIMAEAKEAWLATGGTEEDYTPMDIIVTYDVK